MIPDNYPSQIRLGEDGELLKGISCKHCGYITFNKSQSCEHCGAPYPKPSSALRARLEALRQSEGKKKPTSKPNAWGRVFVMVILLTVFFALTMFVTISMVSNYEPVPRHTVPLNDCTGVCFYR